jgi:hypothetical protein
VKRCVQIRSKKKLDCFMCRVMPKDGGESKHGANKAECSPSFQDSPLPWGLMPNKIPGDIACMKGEGKH